MIAPDRQQATLRFLLAWLDGRVEFVDPGVEEELTLGQLIALGGAVAQRRKGFLLLVRRNWELEVTARRVALPHEVRELYRLPEGQVVDRLIGYQDGARWCPGIAGLEPAESRALRWRVLEYRPTADICRWLGCRPRTVYNHVSEARRKLRRCLGLETSACTRRVHGVK